MQPSLSAGAADSRPARLHSVAPSDRPRQPLRHLALQYGCVWGPCHPRGSHLRAVSSYRSTPGTGPLSSFILPMHLASSRWELPPCPPCPSSLRVLVCSLTRKRCRVDPRVPSPSQDEAHLCRAWGLQPAPTYGLEGEQGLGAGEVWPGGHVVIPTRDPQSPSPVFCP